MNMIDDFLNYLRYERNRSERTAQRYGESLRDFEAFFQNRQDQLSWQSVDADVIRDWMESLMDKGDMASTVNNCLSAVRSFYRYALTRGLVSRDPSYAVKGPKRQKPLPQFVREEEMDRLLDRPEMWGDTLAECRARTIIILLYETGLRRAELIGLDDGDVDLAVGQLKVTGKRNKQRVVPFGREVAEAVRDYQERRNRELPGRDPQALLVTDKGTRIGPHVVTKVVKQYLSLVTTVKKKSPHVLRHSYATAMLNNGASLESVRRLLGHESVATTEVYTHTTFEQLKRVYENAHPRA